MKKSKFTKRIISAVLTISTAFTAISATTITASAFDTSYISEDGMKLVYTGDTMAIDFKGATVAQVPDGEQGCVVVELDSDKLQSFRTKFPTWRDDDEFRIE